MLVLVLGMSIPVLAQQQGGQQEAEGGDAEPVVNVANEGDDAQLCVPSQQPLNTGNLQNQANFGQGSVGALFQQYSDGSNPTVRSDATTDDFEPGGIDFASEPEQATDCAQQSNQNPSAAGG
jgi:hypothetical protein